MMTLTTKFIDSETQLIKETVGVYTDNRLYNELYNYADTMSRNENTIKIVLDKNGTTTVFYGPLSYLEDE